MNHKIPLAELKGKKYGALIVLGEGESTTNRRGEKVRAVDCLCDCGAHKQVSLGNLRSGRTKTCGDASHRKNALPLGKGKRLGRLLTSMKQRCYNQKRESYKNYGGRGVFVCKEWNDSTKSFVDWAMANGYAVGLEIDRTDNDLGYEPSNCRFITPKKNRRNTRRVKLNEVAIVEIRNIKLLLGKDITSRELGEAYGVAGATIRSILNNRIWT